ncbi:MAG: 2-amino-4-oxopentanoate thiolase subunit OrtA [Candidatus Moduliflexus flocculans]|nr:2-amino-4-oxopentanoate thiolase subunit OrtA [Candidatus Moduliflexus flocculans]
MRIAKGSWVQVEQVVMQPGERAPQVPEDTKAVPLMLWVKGTLLEEASVGDTVEIETAIGRRMTGKLVAENPPYTHGFGRPIPELLGVGAELRALLERGDRK